MYRLCRAGAIAALALAAAACEPAPPRADDPPTPTASADAITLPDGADLLVHDVAVGADDAVHAVWVDQAWIGEAPPMPDGHGGGMRHGGGPYGNFANLFYARSDDGGRTWSETLRVNDRPNEVRGLRTSKPEVKADAGGTVHVLWPANRDVSPGGLSRLDAHYARLAPGADAFETARALNDDAGAGEAGDTMRHGDVVSAHAFASFDVAPNGDVHVYWIDSRNAVEGSDLNEIWGASSSDGGETFGPNRRAVERAVCPCCRVAVLAEADGVTLAYRHVYPGNVRALVVRQSARGETWGAERRLTDADWIIEGCPLKPPSIARADGRLVAAWYTGALDPADVYVTSSDGGPFAPALRLPDDATPGDRPEVVASGRTVVAAWDATAPPAPDGPPISRPVGLRYRLSTDGGASFGAVQSVETGDGAGYPDLALLDARTALLSWVEGRQIRFLRVPLAASVGETVAMR